MKAGKPNDAARWLLQMPQDIASVTPQKSAWKQANTGDGINMNELHLPFQIKKSIISA